jgi:hypothetical protein
VITAELLAVLALGPLGLASPSAPGEPGPAGLIVLNDDGGWCWFQDERALVVGDRLVLGSVAAGRHDRSRRGAVEVTGVDLATRALTRVRLSESPLPPEGGYDDHNAPAFLTRDDGRLLAVYAGHGTENRFRYRVSQQPGDPAAWAEERSFTPSPSSRITYSNLHRVPGGRGRILNFYRGLDDRFKPSVAWSDDGGETWTSGGIVIDVADEFRHRPYVKYVSDVRGAVHLLYTEGHPRNYDNSVFHVVLRDGLLHRSDGTPIRPLAEGLRRPEEGTRVFRGAADNVAWVIDASLDAEGRPFVAYSVQTGSAGLPPGQGGEDHRYRLARWNGAEWIDGEIAFAGTRLYPREDDYTGGVALVSGAPDTVFISTNAHPATGAPLVSGADGRRHWEIFRGSRREDASEPGPAWHWTRVTRDSTSDNLRPVVPPTDSREPILLWLRGTYRTYTDYDLEVVGLLPLSPATDSSPRDPGTD